MTPIRKVIIIGSGPAALAAAICLKQRNKLSSTLYEIRSEPTTLGGAVLIPSNGVRLLDRLGVYHSLLARASSTSKAVAHSSRGQELGQFEMAFWSEAKTGYGYFRVMRIDLQDVLLQKAQKEGIQIRYGKQIVSIQTKDDEEETVTFSDGTADTADLLLGCDGIHSSVRTLYVDPEAVPEYSGISMIFSFLSVSDLPPTSPSVTCLHGILTPEGNFGIMPCTASNDTLYWLFSYEVPIPTSGNTREGWEEHRRVEVEGFKTSLLNFLKDSKGEWGSFSKEVIRKTDVVKFYPIFRLPLGRKWSRGHSILLGDAAHAMQPHSGQGVSMALEDAFLLSRLLEGPFDELSDVFAKFDQIRRPRIEKFYNMAANNGDRRRKSGIWAQWFKELALGAFLWVFNNLNLQTWGFGQGDLVYDIDEVEIGDESSQQS